ncbi:hypothetical protein DJ524_07025 [Sulfolobus sp. D5]|nr:hypothetical protein DJ524_07025 [Sulfolobus sp. D5]
MQESFDIRERYIPQLQKPTYLIVSLPDAGLVGSIAGEFLISHLNLKEFGEVFSHKYLPPISHIINGVAKSPLRLYHSDNFILLYKNGLKVIYSGSPFLVIAIVIQIFLKSL